jgi:hypothetical protein
MPKKDCAECGGVGTIACPRCDGSGVGPCPQCGGSGVVKWKDETLHECPSCSGSGEKPGKCHVCKGGLGDRAWPWRTRGMGRLNVVIASLIPELAMRSAPRTRASVT